MVIQQTKRQSDLEKRLQIIRRQVYGKGEKASYQASKLSGNQDNPAQSLNSSIAKASSDLTYLHKDLLKILIFSSFALGAQIILFILSQKHIVSLNFF